MQFCMPDYRYLSFFWTGLLPLSIAMNGNTSVPKTCSGRGNEGKASSSTTRKPTTFDRHRDECYGAKTWAAQIFLSLTRYYRTGIQGPYWLQQTQKYPTEATRTYNSKLRSAAPEVHSPVIGCLAVSHSFIICMVSALIRSAPVCSFFSGISLLQTCPVKQERTHGKTISNGVLIIFFSKVAQFRAS